jgi:hypothetical protein
MGRFDVAHLEHGLSRSKAQVERLGHYRFRVAAGNSLSVVPTVADFLLDRIRHIA